MTRHQLVLTQQIILTLLICCWLWSNSASFKIFSKKVSESSESMDNWFKIFTDHKIYNSDLIKVVFPVEYWPTNMTEGRLVNSASSRGGPCKLWNKCVSWRIGLNSSFFISLERLPLSAVGENCNYKLLD